MQKHLKLILTVTISIHIESLILNFELQKFFEYLIDILYWTEFP